MLRKRSFPVTASRDVIQFKNVIKERLYYREENGSSREISMLDIRAGLPEDVSRYYAVIEMEELPDFYGGIREFRQEPDTGRVYAVLEQPDLVRYETDGSRSLEYAIPLAYADDGGEHPLVKSAEELFREMAADPRGDYVLTEDLDASAVPDSAAAVAGTFSGTLDGNGYRILNLKTSLFETLNGAEIRDLVIEKAAVTAGRRGILADYIRGNSVIEQVFLVDV